MWMRAGSSGVFKGAVNSDSSLEQSSKANGKCAMLHSFKSCRTPTMQLWSGRKPIILIREQFEQLIRHSNENEPLRNQLIIDFPTLMGLRRNEFRLVRWEDAHIDTGHLYIRNSKNKHLYPMALPYQVAEKTKQTKLG